MDILSPGWAECVCVCVCVLVCVLVFVCVIAALIVHLSFLSFPGRVIVYDIKDNRWCGNIQREHKSNNIMFVLPSNL